MKKFISMSLTLSLALANLCNVVSFAEETGKIAEVTVGNTVFSLYGDKKLSIDYEVSPTFWMGVKDLNLNTYYQNGDIQYVEFGAGVKEIPANAFKDYDKITEISLPDGLEKIGANAFYNTSIGEVVLPKSLAVIEKDAFSGCKSLKQVEIRSNDVQLKTSAIGWYFDNDANELKKYGDVVIKGSKASTAEEYANKNGFEFVELISTEEIPNEEENIEDIEYSVSYSLNDGINFENAPDKYKKGEVTALGIPSKEGYSFEGWYMDTDGDSNPDTKISKIDKTQTGDITLIAMWSKVYKINYVLNGGTNYNGAPTKYIKTGENIMLENPKKEGYGFAGWYIDKNGDSIGDTKILMIDTAAAEDITLYAMWEAPYKITYELNGGTNYSQAPNSYTRDTETIVLGSPVKSDMLFIGWTTDAAGANKVTEIKKGSSGDVVLYAQWTNTFSITYELNGGTNYTGAPTSYNTDSETIVLGKPTKTGYAFDGWFTDEEFVNKIEKIEKGTMGDITLYATWKRNKSVSLGGAKYYVTFDSNGGTAVDRQTIQVNYKANIPQNPTRKGYTFAGWYTDSALTKKFDFDTKITKHINLYAKWIKVDEDDEPVYVDGAEAVIVLKIGSKTVKVNGKTIENDVAPIIKNDRTMMPIRVIAEALGANVKWDGKFRIVTVSQGNRQIVLHIDSDIAYINGEVYELDSPAFISEDRTYIPVRFVSEALQCAVDWSEDSRNVTITK